MVEEDESAVNRRKILKMAGVATSAISMTSTASATSLSSTPKDTTVERLSDPNRVAEIIESEASGVLNILVKKGYLNSTSVDELPYTTTHPSRTSIRPASKKEGVATTEFKRDGSTSTVVAVSKNIDQGTMTLYVYPDEKTAKARLSLNDGTEKIVDETRGEVSPSVYCETSTSCTDTVCKTVTEGGCTVEYHKKVKQECCTYSDGSTDCTTLGTSCECEEFVQDYCK